MSILKPKTYNNGKSKSHLTNIKSYLTFIVASPIAYIENYIYLCIVKQKITRQ